MDSILDRDKPDDHNALLCVLDRYEVDIPLLVEHCAEVHYDKGPLLVEHCVVVHYDKGLLLVVRLEAEREDLNKVRNYTRVDNDLDVVVLDLHNG